MKAQVTMCFKQVLIYWQEFVNGQHGQWVDWCIARVGHIWESLGETCVAHPLMTLLAWWVEVG